MRWLASLGGKLRGSPPWVGDGLLALLLVLPAATTVGDNAQPDPIWLFVPFVFLQTLPLAVRRYWPRAVFAITLGAALGTTLLTDSPAMPVGVIVALYTVAAHCDRKTALRAALATGALLIPSYLITPRTGDGGAVLIPATALLAIAWVLGDNLRTRRAYLREVEDKANRLEREREQNARQAAADEQARIARELHDVIAHNVSVMVVQAAAAGDVFDTQPAKAREALASIEHTGREALTELRRLLGAVRSDDGKVPQPGLERLPALIEQVRAAGLDVDLTTEGEQRQLPLGIDLSAYRIVQEALTNTLKHASARRAEITLRYAEDELAIDVTDDGSGSTSNGDQGQGLIGMRERVALYDGDLKAGPRAEGGFGVSARFPLE
jgi:signal transduction histidine kinase